MRYKMKSLMMFRLEVDLPSEYSYSSALEFASKIVYKMKYIIEFGSEIDLPSGYSFPPALVFVSECVVR